MSRPNCRFPEKKAFDSRAIARKARKRTLSHVDKDERRREAHLTAFLCPCGFWHLGNLSQMVVKGLLTRQEAHG